jgi:hypothetical protein
VHGLDGCVRAGAKSNAVGSAELNAASSAELNVASGALA